MVTPACAGMEDMFDAVDEPTHKLAAQICAGCGFVAECVRLRDERIGHAPPAPHGTWAGELWVNGRRATPGVVHRPTAHVRAHSCMTCGVTVEGTAHRCPPCAKAHTKERNATYERTRRRNPEARNTARRRRGVSNDHPCPRCDAAPGEPCRLAGGRTTYIHAARIPKPCDECSTPHTGRSPRCEECRIVARRAGWRAKAARQRTAA